MYSEHSTGPTFRAIVRVRRENDKGKYSTGLYASVSPRSKEGKQRMYDWDFHEEIAAQISAAVKLEVGQSATFDCMIKCWSSKHWTDFGWEYDSGRDVVKYRRLP